MPLKEDLSAYSNLLGYLLVVFYISVSIYRNLLSTFAYIFLSVKLLCLVFTLQFICFCNFVFWVGYEWKFRLSAARLIILTPYYGTYVPKGLPL